MQKITGSNKTNVEEEFDKVFIKIASPDRIRAWSSGEVKRSETINYRTSKPEKGGLFCEKIFGTTKEWECQCGKFKSKRYRGVVCDRCGVEVTSTKVRRERLGHIELASPVAHIWYYASIPSRISLLLDISVSNLKTILYYDKYIVIDPGNTDLKKMQLISEEEFRETKERYGANSFSAGIGGEAIKILLKEIDLVELSQKLRAEMLEKGEKLSAKLLKRLEIVENFKESGNKPEWMILDVISVIPPDLRPMVKLDGGRFATSDLNDLYRRVINRNNRIKRLIDYNAPDVILKNEKRMLQEAVDTLFNNGKIKKVTKSSSNRLLKSLSDILKGKQGRFRQNLLGKRVDYSGRSVIVVGPELRLNQCGIPIKMALELFKPFIMQKLVSRGIVHNIKRAKILVESEVAEVFEVLEEVVLEHPVLLNRAPTLHRLGIQAFEPVLVSGKAIKLHPLVCASFNADFDGDQMPVHIPLTQAAQIECWSLMLSSRNILNPANGAPIILPSHDMVLGVYYLTKERLGDKGEGKRFSSIEEISYAIDSEYISYHAKILFKDNKGTWIETTAGRAIFNSILPEGMDYVNYCIDDKKLKGIVTQIYEERDSNATVEFLDKVKELGFKYSTIFGATISVSDVLIPSSKETLINETNEKVLKIQENYRRGIITNEERYNSITDEWSKTDEKLTAQIMKEFEKSDQGFNPIYMMVSSGARGSKRQIKQLAGMRGLMSKPSGDIIELPIKSNFKEGLSAIEFFISTNGARKGLSDTALKTSDAGYLTRRLVDIAQDVVVNIDDCGTINGVEVSALKDGEEIIEKLADRIEGRFTIERIKHPISGDIIVDVNEEITRKKAIEIEDSGIEVVKIRTVLTCESKHGVCVKCYGKNLTSGKIVDIGEAVGIIAAQSIGQPGTQLTMRTFHVGGTASKITEDNRIALRYPTIVTKIMGHIVETEEENIKERRQIFASKGYIYVRRVLDKIDYKKTYKLKVQNEGKIFKNQVIFENESEKILAKESAIVLIKEDVKKIYLCSQEQRIEIKNGSILMVKEGEDLAESQTIVTFDQFIDPIIAESSGKIKYKDVERSLKEDRSKGANVERKITESAVSGSQQPKIIIEFRGKELNTYDLPAGAVLNVLDGQDVKKGDVIAKILKESAKTEDITGGLPRVSELFEARNPKNSTVIAMVSGIVEEVKVQTKSKRTIVIKDKFGDLYKHEIEAGRYILVRKGDLIEIGEPLCDGDKNPQHILRIMGESALHSFLLNEIQGVYKLQGVEINDKHISVIIRQMLRKVEIKDVGDSKFILNQQRDKYEFFEENRKVLEKGGRPAVATPVMLGITKASLNISSFISAASFQETTNVLTNASIAGAVDELRGLKENVIVGRLIPAGTGMKKYKNIKVYDKDGVDIDLQVKDIIDKKIKENKTEDIKLNFNLDDEN